MALHLPYGAALLPNGLWQPDLSEQEGHKLFIITIIFNLHLFRTRWFELSRKPFFPLLHNPKSLSSVVLPYLALPRGCSIMNSGTGCKVNNARQAKSPSEGYFILPDLIVSEQLSLVNPTKKKKKLFLTLQRSSRAAFCSPQCIPPNSAVGLLKIVSHFPKIVTCPCLR